jgi:hypothetical protein
MILETSEKTPDASDGDACAERESKQISSAARHAEAALGPFYGKQAADESAHNRLPAHQENGIVPVRERDSRVF